MHSLRGKPWACAVVFFTLLVICAQSAFLDDAAAKDNRTPYEDADLKDDYVVFDEYEIDDDKEEEEDEYDNVFGEDDFDDDDEIDDDFVEGEEEEEEDSEEEDDDEEDEEEDDEEDEDEDEEDEDDERRFSGINRRRGRRPHWIHRALNHALRGSLDLDPYFKVNYDFSYSTNSWWNGPNVCETVEETKEDLSQGDSDGRSQILHHMMMTSNECEDTGSVYKCVTQTRFLNLKKTMTRIYECCLGYQREAGESGCTTELPPRTVLETLADLGANDTLEAIKGVAQEEFIEQGNYTIFSPSDSILSIFKPIQNTQPNVVIVTSELMEMAQELERVVAAHIVEGFVKSSFLEDDQVLDTLSGDTIRINMYDLPQQLMTANCRPVTTRDNLAINGVVHMVEGTLNPVTESIASIVSRNPDLSMFKTVIGQSGVLAMLKKDGPYTLLAPSNTAFARMSSYVRDRLLSGQDCVKDVVMNHLLPHVVCSGIMQDSIYTVNLLNNKLNFTRTDDGKKLFIANTQVLDADVMATNGVIHIIDDVIMPNQALGLPEVVARMGASSMLELIQESGLFKEFAQLDNFTAFIPTDEAFMKADPAKWSSLAEGEDGTLKAFLRYHVLTSSESYADLVDSRDDYMTLTGHPLTVKEYRSFPLSMTKVKTVQCAAIERTDVDCCDGVVHLINKVLVPPTGNIMDYLEGNNEFEEFVRLMKKSGLADIVNEGGPFTVFAPNNQAFSRMTPESMVYLEQNPEQLLDFLKHHVTETTVCCSGVLAYNSLLGKTHTTLDQSTLTLGRFGDRVIVNNMPISTCDVIATNGIVHAIDRVIPQAVGKYVVKYNPDRGFWMHFERIFGDDLHDLVDQAQGLPPVIRRFIDLLRREPSGQRDEQARGKEVRQRIRQALIPQRGNPQLDLGQQQPSVPKRLQSFMDRHRAYQAHTGQPGHHAQRNWHSQMQRKLDGIHGRRNRQRHDTLRRA